MLVRSMFDPAVSTSSFGFLPATVPLSKLPATTELNNEINRLATNLPELLTKKQLRACVDKLSDMIAELRVNSEKEKDIALTFLTAIAQAYIFEDTTKPIVHLPAIIAKPLYALSKDRQRFPTMTYNDYVLNNWTKLDPNGGITLDNIKPIITMTGKDDEVWFIMIHVAIEAAAAPAITAAMKLFYESRKPTPNVFVLLDALQAISASIESTIAIMHRMQERCDPDIFWKELRPYLNGWEKTKPADCEDPGVRFEGVGTKDKKPFAYTGASGAQSSIVPTLDAVLGVKHEIDGMFQHLLKFKEFMPITHQALIATLAAFTNVESVVARLDNPLLTKAYETTVATVKHMRGAHLALVHAYIYKPAAAAGIPREAIAGTGGAPIDAYLAGRYQQTGMHHH